MPSNPLDTQAPVRTRFPAALKVGLVALVSVVAAGIGASGCLDRPLCDKDCRPRTTNVFVDTITQKAVDKIDLLFMVDNSSSMSDKQEVLKEAVPDLVDRLVSPDCIDPVNKTFVQKVTDPNADCPPGSEREFTPIKNIHIGVVTSSLGGHGSTSLCVGGETGDIDIEEDNDHAWLIGSRPRYQNTAGAQPVDPNLGFLDWNPVAMMGQPIDPFKVAFQNMVTAAGEFGCGYEASLEAIYRFLGDPLPYQSVLAQPCAAGSGNLCAFPQGKDDKLLAQRAAFLRPDSLLAIIMLTDENDCSIRDTAQFYYAARTEIGLPVGSSQCIANPNDPCCYTCGGNPPDKCADGCNPPPTRDLADPRNLRCYRQKERFGLDFLYPIKRYVNALTQTVICPARADLDPTQCPDGDGDGQGDITANPIFQDLSGGAGLPRDPSLVFLAGIVGVPWQDLAVDPADGNNLTYKTAKQLTAENVWATILGDPHNVQPDDVAQPVPPADTHMLESTLPRPNIPGPNSGYMADAINGHEWGNTKGDDLEYACIFKLKTARDCAQYINMPDPKPKCDCEEVRDGDNNPLCQNQSGAYTTDQVNGKAYPGVRELQVLKEFGNNSIVASICARNVTDTSKQDYGYRPAVDAIVDRLKEALTGKCLPRILKKNELGQIPCSIIEANPVAGPCDPARGRAPAKEVVIAPAQARLKEAGLCDAAGRPACTAFSLCEIQEATGPAGDVCHQQAIIPQDITPGWCYVDPAQQPGDNPALVANCDASQKRILRFVDPTSQTPSHGATVLIACFGASLDEDVPTVSMPTTMPTNTPPPTDAATGG